MSRDESDHVHGWFIEYDGRRIAELEYQRLDGFFWMFRVASLGEHEESGRLLSELANIKRQPAEHFRYRNRATSEVVADDVFMLRYDGRESAGIRDSRRTAAKAWYQRLLDWL